MGPITLLAKHSSRIEIPYLSWTNYGLLTDSNSVDNLLDIYGCPPLEIHARIMDCEYL